MKAKRKQKEMERKIEKENELSKDFQNINSGLKLMDDSSFDR